MLLGFSTIPVEPPFIAFTLSTRLPFPRRAEEEKDRGEGRRRGEKEEERGRREEVSNKREVFMMRLGTSGRL